MKQLLASWHKALLLLAFAVPGIFSATSLCYMMAGHGQVGEIPLAKRIRTHLVDAKVLEARSLEEQAAQLRCEADLVNELNDEQILENYQHKIFDVEGNPVPPELLDSHGGEKSRADGAGGFGSFESELEATLIQQSSADTLLDAMSGSANLAMTNWKDSMDEIEKLLSATETFQISEADSTDFSKLCSDAFDTSLTEADVHIDERKAMMKHAAETGEFDVYGGFIGNMWARLPKTDSFKQEAAQAGP
jgi:hypothetical protein